MLNQKYLGYTAEPKLGFLAIVLRQLAMMRERMKTKAYVLMFLRKSMKTKAYVLMLLG